MTDFLTFIGVQGGRWSLFWGGFGSCLGYLAIFSVGWRKINCHAKGCWRIGLHVVNGTHYITCRKHHPVHDGKVPATAEQIAQAHTDATVMSTRISEPDSPGNPETENK